MTDDTVREFEPPSIDDVQRFSEFRSLLRDSFGLSDEHATRLAFALSERHPALIPGDLTSAHVDGLLRELAQDDQLEAEFRKARDVQN
ncbi:MAG TPA: hypothetical protein VNW92_09170 [Polyangiaceae bacterium]|jgi:hypothetical protein|nr:hypothetical protein [Polyangiaceae bacterium]